MPPKNSTSIPQPQKPKAQSATAAPITTQAIINLIIFAIVCNTINPVQISVYLYAKSTSEKIFMAIELAPSWLEVLGEEFDKGYMVQLRHFLKNEKQAGSKIYPKGSDIFNAFNKTPFDKVKVVILGQDPYHGENQAHGLSFSVQKGITIPPSLRNIYKELQTDIPGFKIPNHGDLKEWAEQGVLLLNATLTVRENTPGSHQKKGWEEFTDTVIKTISDKKEWVVFI